MEDADDSAPRLESIIDAHPPSSVGDSRSNHAAAAEHVYRLRSVTPSEQPLKPRYAMLGAVPAQRI